jgi:arylsulfatase A-like enzyme
MSGATLAQRARPAARRLAVALTFALPVALPLVAQASARRPDVVLILMDDLGYGDLGSYGAPDVRTPNLDRLARESVRLTDFYANHPSCSGTRAALVTGRYQQRVGIEWPIGSVAGDTARGLAPTATSLPQLLRDAGYVTGLVGKWHLGTRPEYRPLRHGFDEFWGFLGGAVDYYAHTSMAQGGRHDLYEGDRETRADGYLTDEITARARGFLERHGAAPRARPFFLEVAYNATHWPYQGPGLAPAARARPDRLRSGTRAEYAAMLQRADSGVGVLLRTLDRLGLARTTLVIFTSDNGGEWLSRNAPLLHRKFTVWEGGIRVPAMLRWPARLPAGVTSPQVGITMDLTATILAAAGAPAPPAARAEGVDLVPLLAARRATERTLHWRALTFTLPLSPVRGQRAMRMGRWKYVRDGTHEFLFDLARDPGERDDLAARDTTRLADLRRRLAAWEAEVDAERATSPLAVPRPDTTGR